MDFVDAGLGNQVEDVCAGSAKPDNADLKTSNLRIYSTDSGASRRSIDIAKYAVVIVLIGQDQREGARTYVLQHLRFRFDATDIGRDLVVVVAVVRLSREIMIGANAIAEVLCAGRIFESRDLAPVVMARMLANPLRGMPLGLFGHVVR